MEFVIGLVAKRIFAWLLRRELKRAAHTQHPAITYAGLLVAKLL